MTNNRISQFFDADSESGIEDSDFISCQSRNDDVVETAVAYVAVDEWQERLLTCIEQDFPLKDTAQELSEIKQRLSVLEEQAVEERQKPDCFQVCECLELVKAKTTELFGEFDVVESEDCEIDGERYFMFNVRAKADLDTIMRMHDEWHFFVSEFPNPLLGLFRLSIDPE